MKSPLLLALAIIVTVGAVICAGIVFNDTPEKPEPEKFTYTVTAEDFIQQGGALDKFALTRITVTLDHAPSEPLEVCFRSTDSCGRVLTISDTSASASIEPPSGHHWVDGQIWYPDYTVELSGIQPGIELVKA